MFMHMPRKWRVVVLLAAAVGVGAYYVLVVRSERVGDWCVHQGSGRLVRDAKSGVSSLDVSYTVTEPGRPLFSCMRLTHHGDGATAAIAIEYQSEKRAALLMEVSDNDGAVYQARLKLEPSETWQRLLLTPDAFDPRDGGRRVDLDRLEGRVEFYDDSSVKAPTTAFANRLRMMTPALTPDGHELKPPTP